jgi:hypothetical protein
MVCCTGIEYLVQELMGFTTPFPLAVRAPSVLVCLLDVLCEVGTFAKQAASVPAGKSFVEAVCQDLVERD